VTELYEVGRSDEGEPFLIMEKLEGRALSHLMRSGEPLPLEQSLSIAMEIAAGLEAVHAAGVLHRDVKPENIFLHEDPDEERTVAKLLDFGLAGNAEEDLLTEAQRTVGTPGYMPPEQARGVDGLDERVDVYGLGVTLYEMLTAALPTEGSTGRQMIEAVVKYPPTPITYFRPDLAGSVGDVIMRALSMKREQRQAHARALRLELARVAESLRERDVLGRL